MALLTEKRVKKTSAPAADSSAGESDSEAAQSSGNEAEGNAGWADSDANQQGPHVRHPGVAKALRQLGELLDEIGPGAALQQQFVVVAQFLGVHQFQRIEAGTWLAVWIQEGGIGQALQVDEVLRGRDQGVQQAGLLLVPGADHAGPLLFAHRVADLGIELDWRC